MILDNNIFWQVFGKSLKVLDFKNREKEKLTTLFRRFCLKRSRFVNPLTKVLKTQKEEKIMVNLPVFVIVVDVQQSLLIHQPLW